jgi:hypothetical protein
MALTVLTVRGRIVDPYRDNVAEPDDAAFVRRECDLQPIGDVAAAFARVKDAVVQRAGRRFTLTRGTDTLFVAFASAAPTVALEDATFDGDPILAIEALHALLPLFGPVELRSEGFVDLVDGHEPAEQVAARYRTYWIDIALHRAKQLGRSPAPPAPVPADPLDARPSRKKVVAAGVFFAAIAIAIVVLWFRDGWTKASTGESCQSGDDCRSGQCQPFDRDRPDSPGVCTEPCSADADCPREMVCGPQRRCVDRAWR